MGEAVYSDINKCTFLVSKTHCILRGVRMLNVTSTQEMQRQKIVFALRPQLPWSSCITSLTWITPVASETHDLLIALGTEQNLAGLSIRMYLSFQPPFSIFDSRYTQRSNTVYLPNKNNKKTQGTLY